MISQQQARNMNGPQGLQVDSPDLLDILILNMKYIALFWNHAKYRDISHLSATSDFNLEHLAWYLCWSCRYRSSTILMAAHTKCHYQACGCSWIHFPSARGFCILSRWRACPVLRRTFVDSKRYNLHQFTVFGWVKLAVLATPSLSSSCTAMAVFASWILRAEVSVTPIQVPGVIFGRYYGCNLQNSSTCHHTNVSITNTKKILFSHFFLSPAHKITICSFFSKIKFWKQPIIPLTKNSHLFSASSSLGSAASVNLKIPSSQKTWDSPTPGGFPLQAPRRPPFGEKSRGVWGRYEIWLNACQQWPTTCLG